MLARLDHIQLMSEAPERLVTFYRDVMGMATDEIDSDRWLCQGPQRRVLIGRGRSNTLSFGAYRCETLDDLSVLRTRLLERGIRLEASPSPLFSDAFCFCDPDGNQLVFGIVQQPAHSGAAQPLTGRLQHLVVASEEAESLMHFYSRVVGLVISDKMLMLDGDTLAGCWMRTDEDKEHHSFAVFQSSQKGIDHHSYEVGDWALIVDWADYLASRGIKLFWGPGRHGPGNNLFVFVLDPDGNRIELSAELETVEPDRPTGIWRNEPDTLNLWGEALMRS